MSNFINISYRSTTKIANEGVLKGIKSSASNYAKGKLIDLGCGTKPYESILKPYIESYFGVDFQPAAEKNYGENTKADLYVDCSNTELESEAFDTLLSTQVMEHIFETDNYLSECYRLLKKNGYGIFTVPFFWQLHSEPYDFFRFTRFSLDRLFSEKGFKIIEIRPLEGAYAALTQAKIVSLYIHCSQQNLIIRLFRRIQLKLWVPVLNFLALHFDKIFYNDKLCINYLVVVKK
jgi:SAM-dependent methyltransferase